MSKNNIRRYIFLSLAAFVAIPALAQYSASFDFTFSVEGDYPVNGSGHAVINDMCYHVTSNGLDIYCDGTTRWMVDLNTREVTVENAEPWTDYLADFRISSEDDTESTVIALLKDGSEVRLNVSNYTQGVPQDAVFKLDVAKLPKEYIVTDLRY